jgi:hypothetical protein
MDFPDFSLELLTSPHQAVSPTHSYSPPRVVRTKAKDPALDPRGILADGHAEFDEPERLNDIAFHVMKEVDELRNEVKSLWLQVRDLYDVDLIAPFEPLGDFELPARSEMVDVSEHLAALDAVHTKLHHQLDSLKEWLSNDNLDALKGDMVTRRELSDEVQVQIAVFTNETEEREARLKATLTSNLRPQIEKNCDTINALRSELEELRETELRLTEVRQTFVSRTPKYQAFEVQFSPFVTQLATLKRKKESREVEIGKLAEKLAGQTEAGRGAVKTKRRADADRKKARQWRQEFSLRQNEEEDQSENLVLGIRIQRPRTLQPAPAKRKTKQSQGHVTNSVRLSPS